MRVSLQLVLAAHVTANMSKSEGHEEKYFLTSTGEEEAPAGLHGPPSRDLSVVIPAYNEELRSESSGFGAALFYSCFLWSVRIV